MCPLLQRKRLPRAYADLVAGMKMHQGKLRHLTLQQDLVAASIIIAAARSRHDDGAFARFLRPEPDRKAERVVLVKIAEVIDVEFIVTLEQHCLAMRAIDGIH